MAPRSASAKSRDGFTSSVFKITRHTKGATTRNGRVVPRATPAIPMTRTSVIDSARLSPALASAINVSGRTIPFAVTMPAPVSQRLATSQPATSTRAGRTLSRKPSPIQ